MKRGSLKNYDGFKPSLYVGETARSFKGRSKEHLDAFKTGSQTSNIRAHQDQCHGGSQDINFVFKIVGAPRSALSRQVGEAIRIRNRGGEGSILNAKGEYNRCTITRLTLGEEQEGEKTKPQKMDEGEGEQAYQWIENEGKNWILKKSRGRAKNDKLANQSLGKAKTQEGGEKRRGGQDPLTHGRVKKRKFQLVDTDWGNKTNMEDLGLNKPLGSILEGTDTRTEPLLVDEVKKSVGGGGLPENDLDLSNPDPVGNLVNTSNEDCEAHIRGGGEEICTVVRKKCVRHNLSAVVRKTKKQVWAKSKRTGLYSFRTTTSVLWECPIKISQMEGPQKTQFLGTDVMDQGNSLEAVNCDQISERIS